MGDRFKHACSLTCEELTQRTDEVAGRLRQAKAFEETEDGLSFIFPGDAASVRGLLDFINAERRCCPFIAFELAFEPNLGPIRVTLRASDEQLKTLPQNSAITSL